MLLRRFLIFEQHHLVTVGAPILITGPTGTGKSVFVSQLLNHELPQDKWTPIEVAFSAKTTANQTQEIMDGKLGKRRKGIFGPPIGTVGKYSKRTRASIAYMEAL